MDKSRITRMAVVFTIVLVLELGVLGAVQAQGEGLPDSFDVPMPREGDQVRYTYRLVPDADADTSRRATILRADGSIEGDGNYMPNAPTQAEPYQDFRVLPARNVGLADGSDHATYAAHILQYGVDMQGQPVAGFDAIVDVDATDRQALLITASRVTTESRDGHQYAINSTSTYEADQPASSEGCKGCGSSGAALFVGHRLPQVPACLAFNRLQGTTVSTDESVRILPDCNIDLSVFWRPDPSLRGGFGSTGIPGFNAEFRATRTETLQDGMQAVVFQAKWAQSTKEIWLSPQVPYPVRLVADEHWGTENPALNYVLTVELDRLVAGGKPLPIAGGEPFPGGWSTVRPVMAERQPWGMDEQGTAAPFAASAAWDYLQDAEPSLRGLAAVAAQFEESLDRDSGTDTTQRSWEFAFAIDGGERVAKVTQTTESSALDALPPDFRRLVGQDPAGNVTYTHTASPLRTVERPTVQQLPAQMPTVASLWDSWRQKAANSPTFAHAAPNAWGFDIRLSPTATRNGEPVPRTAVSEWEAGRRLERTEGDDTTHELSMLRLHADGLVVEFEQRQQMSGPGPASPGIATQPAPKLETASGIAWSAPSAPMVAGASAVAVAFGLAGAWLGKGAKGIGALLLFSRVEDPEAAHPARQALLQAIRASPGLHFKELQRRSGQGRSSTLHHVRKLIAAGHVREVRTAGYTCYVPRELGNRDLSAAVPVLRSPGARRLFAAALAHPGLPQGELARLAGLKASTASYHMQRLAQAGLVSTAQGVHVTPLGQNAHEAGVAT